MLDFFREDYPIVDEGLVKPFPNEIRESEINAKSNEVTTKTRRSKYYFAFSEMLAKHDEYMPYKAVSAINTMCSHSFKY